MSIFKKNIAANLFGQSTLLALGFLSFRYIYNDLGEDALGIIYFSTFISTLLAGALDLGLTKAATREISRFYTSEPVYIRSLLQTFSLFYCIMFFVLLVAFLVSSPLIIKNWISLTELDVETALDVLVVIGATSLLVIPKALMTCICVGMQRMHINNSINVVITAAQHAGTIYLIIANAELLSVAYWIGTTNVGSFILYLYFSGRLISYKCLMPRASISSLRRVRHYLTHMALVSVLNISFKHLDKLLLSMFFPIGTLGVYNFLMLNVTKLGVIADSATQALFPLLSVLNKEREREEIKRKVFQTYDILVFGMIPIFTAPVFFCIPLFSFLMGADEAAEIHLPLIMLCISFYLNGVHRLFNIFLSSAGETIYLVRGSTILFMSSPFTIFLVYNYGVIGASSSWLATQVVGLAYTVMVVHRRGIIGSLSILVKAALKAVALGAIIYGVAWEVVQLAGKDIFYQISVFLIASAAYWLVALSLSDSGFKDLAVAAFRQIKRTNHGDIS